MKDHWHNTCPKCGELKYRRSKFCMKCHTEALQLKPSKHKKDKCACGRDKLVTSKRCRGCSTGKDIELAEYRGRNKADLPSPALGTVGRDWLIQFTAILLGDGCIHARLSPGGTLSLNLFIRLRADDVGALEEIQTALGGSVKVARPAGKSPEAIWSVTKAKDIRTILEAVQGSVIIPMRKTTEFAIALEFLRWRSSASFHRVDRSTIAEFHERLRVAKLLDS